tara:strand:+ start:434 stop:1351 length:918 start_codon:yes stop_codon:yes gene_type:complete
MRIRNTLIFSIFIVSIFGCKNEAEENNNSEQITEESSIKRKEKQLNITILLDLSDRIEPTKYPTSPEHFERDIEVVNYFTELFKKDMEKKGAFMAKGKMKVIFSPRPNDPGINSIAGGLSVDLSKTQSTKEKKEIFDNLSLNFRENLAKIYTRTIEKKDYPGSDIWRFFKNDVVDYCIEENTDYRNILVLITDGYIFHKSSIERDKNRTASLLPDDIARNGMRNSGWQKKFADEDFGYITTRTDLNNLDVLVLEINPSKVYSNDEDVIKGYLRKWFTEMKVNSYKFYNSDLPEYTKSKIDKFISN